MANTTNNLSRGSDVDEICTLFEIFSSCPTAYKFENI